MTSPGRQPSTDLVGRVIDKYEIVRLLGQGGMGRVYEGLNRTIGKRVALKFIERDAATSDAVARFQREAQAASAVESAHIVEIFDAGVSEDGMPFIVMELLRGEDLGHRIRRLGRLELDEALVVTAQILRGLHRAHEVGIIHRDLKPDNVFLLDRDDDQIFTKILDFGVSKITKRGEVGATTITREGTVIGTPVYMSPEQAQALPDVDGQADLWSVGAILYECLSGRPPHSGASYEQVIVNICMKDVDDIRLHNPAVPEGVARVLAKALTRDRAARFQTARDFLDALVPESGGILSARSVSSASGARKAAAIHSSPPGAPGPATLGAVSTVAALPSSLPTAGRASSSRGRLVVGVGAGALLLGVAVALVVSTRRAEDRASSRQGEVLAATGLVSTGAPAASISPEPSAPPEPSSSTTASTPSSSTSPRSDSSAGPGPSSASASSASASSASASAHSGPSPAASMARPAGSVVPRSGPAGGKPGLGGELQLQTH
jgi:serine/threonine-protein kinase